MSINRVVSLYIEQTNLCDTTDIEQTFENVYMQKDFGECLCVEQISLVD